MAFRVEHGYPVPPTPGRVFYPFGDMRPGESFAVSRDQLPKARAAASAYGRRHGWRFATFKQDDEVWRVWRVE
jgi:hypothetical protein